MRCNCRQIWEADGRARLQHDATNIGAILTEQRLMMSSSYLHQQADWQ